MDYEQMTTPQLQAECKRRNLPSGRVKAELVDRLQAADAVAADPNDETAEPEMTVEQEPERIVNVVWPQPERSELPAPEPTVEAADPVPPETVAPTVFRHTFPAGPEGPNDDQHTAYRAQTRQAAIDAGLSPRGDARRTGTVDGREVYEVSVRPGSAP